jgi:YidC/Oxa1 family membrane protein insertase
MDKKFIYSVMLSIATVWLLQYYFWGPKKSGAHQGVVSVEQMQQAHQPGQPIKVAATEDLYKPINYDIDFAQEKINAAEGVAVVETKLLTATFSTYGAILKSLDYKGHLSKNKQPLRTVYDKGAHDEELRKQGCFLLAFEQKTPYFYRLVDRIVEKNTERIVYQADYLGWVIRKIYTMYSDRYQIDCTIECEPKTEQVAPVKPRLFFVSPIIHEIADDAIVPFMLNESTSSVETKDIDAVQGLAWYWVQSKPLFGASDKYFAHGLINDESKFVRRAFYKKIDEKMLLPVLEGPEVTEKQSWKLSFYFGPKLHDHLAYVDDRLNDILSFGWLSWFCKLILKLLQWIHSYIGNYGVAIIVLTFLLKLPFLPFSLYARRLMTNYQKHQHYLNRIRMKYKADPRMQQQELMKYHHDHNLSPATPVIGCLPLLIQMPILFSLYRVLGNYLDLYQAPFFGWITDLSAKDPYYVIPVLMGISMLWQQSLTAVGDEKQKVVMWFMSIIMTVVFSSFPAGLVLYWFMNNILTIMEDYLRKLVYGD